MTSAEEHLMDWLRDAHAMEEQAEKMLSATSSRIENYPTLKARIDSHLIETRRQGELIRSCIERRGGDTSTLKDLAGKMTAMAQGMSGMFASDEIVKATMASYTFEHFEISSYRALAAAAAAVGDHQTQQICQEILIEEEAMAAWLAEQLPVVTLQFLNLAETPGATAKR